MFFSRVLLGFLNVRRHFLPAHGIRKLTNKCYLTFDRVQWQSAFFFSLINYTSSGQKPKNLMDSPFKGRYHMKIFDRFYAPLSGR
jgi:hypothetical protein